MPNQEEKKPSVDWELLQRFGVRWAVLSAMQIDLASRRATLPGEISDGLQSARIKIASGCYSVCDVEASLAMVEAKLLPVASSQGDTYVSEWSELLALSLRQDITLESVVTIPRLQAVRVDCAEMIACGCRALGEPK